MPVLVALAGLPGVGKTTVARHLCRLTGAAFLRIDSIEHVLHARDPGRDLRDDGYVLAAALAGDNLRLGLDAVTDCVNPSAAMREIFRAAAHAAGARCLGVELVCSDRAQHRRRVAARQPDLPGGRVPDWAAVEARDYEPWEEAALRLDTARLSPDAAAKRIAAAMRG